LTFSTGMYARLAFATVVQVDPNILLVDEVLSAADGKKASKLFGYLRRKEKLRYQPMLLCLIIEPHFTIYHTFIERRNNKAADFNHN
jgi:energy-coupling factor transporter ATP-binding protein EcfA2